MRKAILAVLAMGAMATSHAALTLPVTETFPAGTADNAWDNYDGNPYSVLEAFSPSAPGGDGNVMNVNDGSGHGQIFLDADDGTTGDVKITAYVYLPSNTTVWSRVGITVRVQTSATVPWRPDGYYFILDTDGTEYLRLAKYNGEVFNTVHQSAAAGDYTLDAWQKLELIAVGDRIVGKLNDVVKFDVTDDAGETVPGAPFLTGKIGLYNYTSGSIAGGGSASLFDRVTIEAATVADLPSASVEGWEVYQ